MAQVTAAIAVAVSGLFAVTLLRRWWARGRTNRALLIWGIALVMFCAASTGLFTGVVGGWTSAEFRVFYLFGAILNVPWLALGSIAVNARSVVVSRWTGGILLIVAGVVVRQALIADVPELWWPSVVLAAAWGCALLIGTERVVVYSAGAVLVMFSVVATMQVLTATYVVSLPTTGLPEGAELFPTLVRGLAVAGNSVGAVTVIVSALVSSAALVWRRPERAADRQIAADARTGGYAHALAQWIFRGRTGHGVELAHLVRGNLLIALGVGLAAAGGVLSFLGDTVGHAIAFTIGVSIMYAGFVRTTRLVGD